MNNISNSAFVPILLSCASLLVHLPAAHGTTLQVPSEDYPTIQAAMNVALPGDTVLVAPGTYHETVVLSAGVVLQGSGRENTIIDGGGGDLPLPVVTLEDDPTGSAAVRGFTLQNGVVGLRAVNSAIEVAQNSIRQNLYGGVAVWRGRCAISNNRIVDNGGPGVRADESDGVITDNEFMGNQAVLGSYFPSGPIAGGVECNLSGNMQILRNTFISNSGDGAGGIAVDRLRDGASCLIEGNIVEANSGNAGGIYAGEWESGDTTGMLVKGNTVRKNQGGESGGVFVQGYVEVTGNEIRDNVGSGLFYRGYDMAYAVIRQNTIAGNVGDLGRGAGLVMETTFGTLVSDNIVENNSPRGMFIDYVEGEVRGNTVSGHPETGIQVARNAGRVLRFDGNTVRNNQADNGAGFSLVSGVFILENNLIEGNWAEWSGGALRCEGDDLTMLGNIIRDNGVLDEWLPSIVYVSYNSRFLIEHNVIADNHGIGLVPAGSGGGSVRGNRIERNTAGGMGSWQTIHTITDNLICNNGGWGIHVPADGALLANNMVVGNENGVALDFNGQAADFLNNTVVGSQATGLYVVAWAQPSSPVRIHNNILWGNGLDLDLYPWWAWWDPDSVDLFAQYSHNLYVTGGDYVGASPLSADPLLADWPNGDFHLLLGSPCIDAGLTAVLPADLESDFYGTPRVSNDAVDIGAAEFRLPAITFSVRMATAKFFREGEARVSLIADLDMPLPTPVDTLSLDFDDVRLFALPFSAFRPGDQPAVYVYAEKGLIVRIDFGTRRLFVHTPNLPVPGVDNSDGVDIHFRAGAVASEENIAMWELVQEQRWIYVRPGLSEPPPTDD